MKKTLKSVLAVLFVVLMLSVTMVSASAAAGPTVKVKSVATSSVTIYWTKVSTALSYEIQRSTDAKTWTTIATGVKTTEYTDSKSLTTGKSYAYRVRGKFLIGSSDWSSYVVGKPLPEKVTGLKVTAANATAVKLQWNKVAGVNGYRVQYYGGGQWKNYKDLTANSIVISGLKLGTNYHFRVAAIKIVSSKYVYGPVSDYIKTSPVLPATSTVALAGVNATQMKIAWAGVSGAKGFEIFNHTTGKWTDAGAKTNIILSGFKPGEQVTFTVRAYAGSVKGLESKQVTFKTAPAVPSGVTIKEVTDSSLHYTWEPVEGADGYQAAYFTRANNAWVTLPLTTGTSATVTGLPGLTECGFRVRAYVQNSNVYKISAYATSAYSANKVGKTGLPAPTVSALTGTTTTATSIKWTAVSGATGYIVEKYDSGSKEWLSYNYSNSEWLAADEINDDSNIVTTSLTFTDDNTRTPTRGDVFRVRAIDASGSPGTYSAPVTAFTKGILMNNTASTFSMQQTIRWPDAADAVSYEIRVKTPVNAYETLCTFNASKVRRTDGTCQANICLAPKSIHSLIILYTDASGRTNTATNWITFNVGDFHILASNHSYYNASVNSQLLYLAQAINNTKAYEGNINVMNNSKIAYDINYLKFLLWEFDTPEEIANFFARFDEEGSESIPTKAEEIFNADYDFTNGVAVNEDGRSIRLKSFIEPSSNDTQSAYLYNSQNYNAWKNGFSSVKTTKNADGGYTIALTFKQEKMEANYHNGFMSSFSSSDFSTASGLSVSNLTIGTSTLTVKIDKDGILQSYVASSPYSAKFAASITTDEEVDSDELGNLPAGSIVAMEMGIAGKTDFNFTFTK